MLQAFNEYFEKPLDTNTFYSKCSKVFLTSTGKEVVTIDDFIKIMFWFGPLDADTTFLSRISMLCAQPWFFADITQAEAENILKTKKSSGTWLIRFGEAKYDSPTREYVLSGRWTYCSTTTSSSFSSSFLLFLFPSLSLTLCAFSNF
jgi:hypothetical protein